MSKLLNQVMIEPFGLFILRQDKVGNLICDMPYLGTLSYTMSSRDMTLRESRAIFEGDDNGRCVWGNIYLDGRLITEYFDYVMDGYGYGCGPTDLEVVVRCLVNVMNRKRRSFLAHYQRDHASLRLMVDMLTAVNEHLSKVRRDERRNSDAWIYGYIGT